MKTSLKKAKKCFKNVYLEFLTQLHKGYLLGGGVVQGFMSERVLSRFFPQIRSVVRQLHTKCN